MLSDQQNNRALIAMFSTRSIIGIAHFDKNESVFANSNGGRNAKRRVSVSLITSAFALWAFTPERRIELGDMPQLSRNAALNLRTL